MALYELISSNISFSSYGIVRKIDLWEEKEDCKKEVLWSILMKISGVAEEKKSAEVREQVLLMVFIDSLHYNHD